MTQHVFDFACLAAVLVSLGCVPSPSPAPMPPDATDAAPVAMDDALPPQTPCQAACTTLERLGCREGAFDDCVRVFSHLDGTSEVRTPSGKPLSCSAIASSASPSDVRALGLGCGP